MAMGRSTKGKVVPLWETDAVTDGGASKGAEVFKGAPLDGPRQFPVVSTLPRLPVMIPDEILDYYGWVFCQGGFLNLQMTFEQFLTVVAAVSPSGLCPEYDDDGYAVSTE
ncbi:MAG: hypothetical protein WA005_01585 [Candidatus Binataceae bacterium]